MNSYTPKQLAKLANLTPRQITSLCSDGVFPSAQKVNGYWHIPQEEALAWIAERESTVEVLPPEGLAVVPQETAREFVLAIVAEATKKQAEEVEELEKKVAELEDRLAEEAKRNQEEVAEVAERLGRLEERKMRPWWRRWF